MTKPNTDTNVLIIKSSPLQDHSVSNEIADYLQSQLTNSDKTYQINIRDLAQTPPPLLNGQTIQAFYTAEEQLTFEQKDILQPSLALIEELKNADIIVFAAAMHNFSITGLLKAYIDQICRMGHTFTYNDNGPEGLLKNKKAVVIASAGMDFQQEHAIHMDFQSPYLQHILTFIGITDIHLVPVQGVSMGEDSAVSAKNAAKDKIETLVAAVL